MRRKKSYCSLDRPDESFSDIEYYDLFLKYLMLKNKHIALLIDLIKDLQT